MKLFINNHQNNLHRKPWCGGEVVFVSILLNRSIKFNIIKLWFEVENFEWWADPQAKP